MDRFLALLVVPRGVTTEAYDFVPIVRGPRQGRVPLVAPERAW